MKNLDTKESTFVIVEKGGKMFKHYTDQFVPLEIALETYCTLHDFKMLEYHAERLKFIVAAPCPHFKQTVVEVRLVSGHLMRIEQIFTASKDDALEGIWTLEQREVTELE